MKKQDKGFTLIELVIVVAVLAILVGLLAPQYTKYVEKARRAACEANMETIAREYMVRAMEETPRNSEEAKAVLRAIVVSQGGEDENENGKKSALSDDGGSGGGNALGNGGVYTGFCKKGGKYTCTFPKNGFFNVDINCSVHGVGNIDVKTLKERLEGITFSDIDDWKAAYSDLKTYFYNHTNIDSEAVGTSDSKGSYGKYDSLAAAVSAKLTAQGIDTTNRSWRMYKKGDTYNLFLTDRKITAADAKGDTKIKCQKYDITANKIVYGEVTVTISTANGKAYPVIKGDSFEEIK